MSITPGVQIQVLNLEKEMKETSTITLETYSCKFEDVVTHEGNIPDS